MGESKLKELKIEVPAEKEKKAVKITEKKQKKLKGILSDLDKEMKRIDRIRKRVKDEKISFYSPKENKKMIEEIEVPPLKLFKEKSKEKN